MGVLQEPNDTVFKLVSLPRWQRDWISSHRNINFSGLAQEVIIELIKQNDKSYFEKNRRYLESKVVYRHDAIVAVIKKTQMPPNTF